MNMASDLDGLGYRGKTVVVTGGASGMGEAVARILGDLGAHVHIVDIQEPKVPHAGFYQCDLSDFDQVRATAEALKAVARCSRAISQPWRWTAATSPSCTAIPTTSRSMRAR